MPSTSRSQENGRDWSVNPKITHIDGLEELWAETHGDPRITVAVLDGPVDRSHPALIGAVLEEVPTPCSAEHYDARAFAHGTHVASVIFGQQGGPVLGIAPRCRGLIVPIYRAGVDGSLLPCTQQNLAEAITEAV